MGNFSKRVKQRRFERKIKRLLFFYIFPFLFIFVLIILFFNSNFLAIKKINFSVNKKYDTKKALFEINEILNQKYFGIFSKRNYIFYPKTEIQEKIKNNFPEIKNINISSEVFLDSIKINLFLESEKNLFCKSLKKVNCFKLSQHGKIFENIKNVKAKNKIIFISKEKKLGDNYFDSDFDRKNIEALIDFLSKKYKLKIRYFIKENKYFYILILENNTKILLNSDFDLENFKKVFTKITSTSDLKIEDGNFKNKVNYINLRLKNKIFYCLGDEECAKNY